MAALACHLPGKSEGSYSTAESNLAPRTQHPRLGQLAGRHVMVSVDMEAIACGNEPLFQVRDRVYFSAVRKCGSVRRVSSPL
jgi:hypothetical protein